MRMCIPHVGSRFTLDKDWTFKLYFESRNAALLALHKIDIKSMDWYSTFVGGRNNQYSEKWELKHVNCTLPAGTLLEVDRMYIRAQNKGKSGADNYDSLTFRIIETTFKGVGKKHPRMWAKLDDVNTMEVTW